MSRKIPSKIFISYRRDDTDAVAENIYHHLKEAFGDVVFKDNMRIGPGDVWDREILTHLESSDVVIVLIGDKWFIQDKHGCVRLEDEEDWVRKEIEYSLDREKKVVPLLVDPAQAPTPRSFRHLPLLAKKFPFRQALSVNSRELIKDLSRFIFIDLPEMGIPLLQQNPSEPGALELNEVDVLANYPLPVKPDKRNLPPPYVGLRPFAAGESFLFFGRDQDILKLIKKLESQCRDKKIILYHGRSGVGKSSLLTAGLYPRMKRGGWEAPPPCRRKKENGLAADLESLLQTYSDKFLRHLFVLDQVEEIFSNPWDEPEQEISALQDALIHFRDNYDNACLLLSFRSDYFTQVRKLLDDRNILYDELELFPLDREGILKAITGIMEKPELQAFYNISFDPAGLPKEIRDDVVKDKNSSHVTTLLQYQMDKLFQLAAPRWADDPTPVTITSEHYSEDFRKDNLERMLDVEFEHLQKDWPEQTTGGLAFDVLQQYITDQTTARERKDDHILALYEGHCKNFPAFFDYLKNRRSLLIGNKTEEGQDAGARLAHDSLAPLLLARFRVSEAPAQQAQRIFESKKYLGDDKKIHFKSIQDKEDIALLGHARAFMRRWSAAETEAFEQGKKAVEESEAQLLEKTRSVFNSFAEVGKDLIKSLDHAEALKKIEVAIEVDIALQTKQKNLREPLEELLFFFAEAGRRPERARKAAELLLQLEPEKESLRAALVQCETEKWDQRAQFSGLLRVLPGYESLQRRYYPDMIDIEGDTYEMGRDSNYLQHTVTLRPFRLAATPLSFYQYALYCEASGKSIIARTPAWGRIGDHPLVNISWYDAAVFCNWLSEQYGRAPCYVILDEKERDKENNRVENDYLKWKVTWNKNANGFRLPTEAEWEFAARGGKQSKGFKFAGSNDPAEVAWSWENSGDKPLSGEWDFNRILENNGRTHPVADKKMKPNELGLYDMSGNVWEWCWDWHDKAYYQTCAKEGIAQNPPGPDGSDTGRVLRGGSWLSGNNYCQVSVRDRYFPNDRSYDIGFRLAQDSL